MTTAVRNKVRPVRMIGDGRPECSAADREVIAGEPDDAATAERCPTCKGHGLVRNVGPNAGRHYRTVKGAQEAMGKGHAKDCAACDGSGLLVKAPF
jgi:DnaJ-class molecular chaperone